MQNVNAMYEIIWTKSYQRFGCATKIYEHNGEISTDPSHDLAHLLIASCSSLEWYPSGTDEQLRLAEYNAVLLENILDRSYSAASQPGLEAGIIDGAINHARWFVENHYSPFPISAEEAYRRFCFRIRLEDLVRLSPYFFKQKARERNSRSATEFWLQFSSDAVPVAPNGSPHQAILFRQLSSIAF
jgi:hypothetical protein